MGSVYLAKDIALSREVAIKVIAANLLSDETMISRFRFEAQTVASLRHPNIVNVHAVRQSDDLHYFVMEFIDGPPLRSIVKGHAPLDVEVVRSLLFQIGSALSYAHRTRGGVIHRDIKPANIMVSLEGSAFVTDFGISKIAETQSGLTQTGATIGTPEYMSPEQCRGEPLTGASDQYALGIMAYDMLCGHTPFSGTQYYIMVAHTSEPPKPIREVRPDCPAQVADVVERMLAKMPEERCPDLDSAVAAMGGGPLGYQDPVRTRIVALTGATLINVPAVDARPSQPSEAAAAETATSVTVSGIPAIVETGDTFTLAADVKGSGQSSLTGLGVMWASADPSIAKVEGGVVEALKPGTVSIMATAGNVANSVLLTVAEPSPATVLVRPGSVRIHRGGRLGLSATVQDRKGRAMERAVIWRTKDEAIATVTEEGQVEATGGGTVSIVAQSEGATGTAEIIVEVPVPATTPETAVSVPPLRRGNSCRGFRIARPGSGAHQGGCRSSRDVSAASQIAKQVASGASEGGPGAGQAGRRTDPEVPADSKAPCGTRSRRPSSFASEAAAEWRPSRLPSPGCDCSVDHRPARGGIRGHQHGGRRFVPGSDPSGRAGWGCDSGGWGGVHASTGRDRREPDPADWGRSSGRGGRSGAVGCDRRESADARHRDATCWRSCGSIHWRHGSAGRECYCPRGGHHDARRHHRARRYADARRRPATDPTRSANRSLGHRDGGRRDAGGQRAGVHGRRHADDRRLRPLVAFFQRRGPICRRQRRR